jgi:hypothetical protein
MAALVVASVLFVALSAWAVAWRLIAASVEQGINEFFAIEGLNRREWNCAKHSISGFPARVEYACEILSLNIETNRGPVGIKIARLDAFATALSPNVIHIAITSPAELLSHDPSITDARLSWAEATADISLSNGEIASAAFALRNIDGELRETSASTESFNASGIDAAFEVNKSASLGALTISSSLNSFRTTRIDAFFGDRSPIDGRLNLTANKVDLNGAGSAIALLEQWRRSNGVIDITELRLVRGELDVGAKGALSLDESRRPRGAAEISARNPQKLLQSLGFPATVPGSSASTASDSSRSQLSGANQEFKTSIALRDGRIYLGVIPLPISLPPLY